MMKMPFVNVDDGMSIYVEDTVNVNVRMSDTISGSKAVLFIHGWPLSHKIFEYQFTELANNGYRRIGIDLRGFGRSDRPWTAYN